MNFLNQLLEQSRSLFVSMTPGSRVLAGLILAAILVGGGFLVKDSQSYDMEYLFGGHTFKESELQMAETAMSNAGLKDYERIGLRIRVPRTQRDLYVKALASGGATPKLLGGAIGQALADANMLEPLSTTKARLLEAQQLNVAQALEKLPFVDAAQVSYDERREGFATQLQSTASIFIQPRGNRPLTETQKRSIMKQVEASFSGLKYENVSLMDLSNGESMQGISDPMTTEQQRYYQQKYAAEQQLREKALNLLADYGEVKVEANVELDPILREESEILTYADKPVTVERTTQKKDSELVRDGTGGRPGVDPNVSVSTNQGKTLSSGTNQSSKTKEQQESERTIVGQTTTLSEKVGLIMKSATLTVAIPNSYYNIAWRREWQELNPGKSPIPDLSLTDFTKYKEDIHKKIQVSLASLLPPPPPGQDARPQVTVTEYIDMPIEAIAAPSMASNAISWFGDNWQSLGMFGLAIVALMALRSFVASPQTPSNDADFDKGFNLPLDESIDAEIAAVNADASGTIGDIGGEEGEDSADGKPNGSKFNVSGDEIRSELSNVIKTNPDIAATLLRTWIGGDAA